MPLRNLYEPSTPHWQAVSGGAGTVSVSLDSLPLFTGNFNSCGATQIPLPLGFGQIYITSAPCPLSPGSNFLVNLSVALPTNTPSGSYEVTINANDQTSGDFYCADARFSL